MAMRKRESEVFPNAAGIDVGASSHWVAVPRQATDDPVREFGTANTAVAHKLARMIYFMLTRGEDYVDQGQQKYEEQQRQRSIAALRRRPRLRHHACDSGSCIAPARICFSGVLHQRSNVPFRSTTEIRLDVWPPIPG